MLSEHERKRICDAIRHGARMVVGHDHAGRQIIKIFKGPYGLLAERIECSKTDVSHIRKMLALNKSDAA